MLEKALEKLESQFKAEKDPVRKQFAKPVLEHMKKRCREDAGLCQDVLQEHKTWGRCYAHITKTARQHIKGNAGAVIDSTVFEWAEDYFRQDDKAQIERQAKQEKEQKAKEAKRKAQKASKKPAKPKKKVDENEDLLQEVQRLRMENEYLKKLNALVQEREKSEQKKESK